MSEFILAIRKHSSVGYIISAYSAETGGNFLKINEILSASSLEDSKNNFSENQRRIIRLNESYSDIQLTKTFASKKTDTAISFLSALTDDMLENRIRPHIEKKIAQIFDILKTDKIRIFHKVGTSKNLYPEDEINVNRKAASTIFNIVKHSEGTRYFLSVRHSDRIIVITDKPAIILSNQPCLIVLENDFFFFEDIDAKKLIPFLSKKFIHIPKSAEQKWFQTFASKAVKLYDVNAEGFDITLNKVKPKIEITLENNWQDKYVFSLRFQYDTKYFLPSSSNLSVTEFDESDFSFVKTERNFDFENEFYGFLESLGLARLSDNEFGLPQKFSHPEIQHRAIVFWLNAHPNIFEREDMVFIQRFGEKNYFTDSVHLDFAVNAEKDWFDIQAVVHFGNFDIPFVQLKENILNKKHEFLLPDGTSALIPDLWFSKYESFFLHVDSSKYKLKLKKHHFKILQDAENESKTQVGIGRLELPENFEIAVPDDIRADLRPYQKSGFAWMTLLHENGMGGCLADDMGLGKTLQTITFLQYLKNKAKQKSASDPNLDLVQVDIFNKVPAEHKPVLIVMPVSLIHNWEFEIMKFSPFLKVLKYRGKTRISKLDELQKYDVVLTGYGLIRNDIEALKQHKFAYIILDESQFIKNPDSKTYKAIMDLNGENRLVLTGTPIENSLTDLWAQMNFINPGILGSREFFKQNYLSFIEKDAEHERGKALSEIIKPFFLRRTKSEVAKDLPELTEQIIYCGMLPEQQEIYDAEKSKIRNYLLSTENGPKNSKSIMIIQALTKLRQLANHPKLTDKTYEGESGKFEEIIRSIENILAENHKVLIFSSFVRHLKIVADYFESRNLPYAMLTGATTDRAGAVAQFQENPDVKLFLISIKTGGTGLNLTEADYVFILDPWWNPAVEAQAVNRAHRIGQHKNVMVYRFITRKTVEEKIMKLQSSKLQLANQFIQSNNPLKGLKMSDIEGLFD